MSTRAWNVSYQDAIGLALETTIDGVRVPYLSLDKLIESKDSSRYQDQIDRARLLDLQRQKRAQS